jgi:hypothetical protein
LLLSSIPGVGSRPCINSQTNWTGEELVASGCQGDSCQQTVRISRWCFGWGVQAYSSFLYSTFVALSGWEFFLLMFSFLLQFEFASSSCFTC